MYSKSNLSQVKGGDIVNKNCANCRHDDDYFDCSQCVDHDEYEAKRDEE